MTKLTQSHKKLSRRAFLRSLGLAAGGVALATVGTGWYALEVEPQQIEVVRVSVSPHRLPEAFDGLTIAHISDLHFGALVEAREIRAAIDIIRGLKPDIVVVTGDHVHRVTHGEPDLVVQELSRLTASLGAFAVMGNHDYWTNGPVVARSLQQAGLAVLRNAHTAIKRDGQTLYIAGLDDVWERHHDLKATLQGVPEDGCVLLLAHEPDIADECAQDPRFALQMSGHTHAGQVRLPGRGPLVVPRYGLKYREGLWQIGNMQLYVNRGIGVIWPPVRINCRPEVTLYTLAA
jgi:predicted MPP superfamily phosphohydrolase